MTGSQSSDPLHRTWTDVFQPAIASVQQTVSTIGKAIITLFSDDHRSLSVEQALQKLGVDILLSVIDANRAVIVGLIRLGADIIKDFNDYLNKSINIPIFSALWKTCISGGTDLSFLDGLALLLAIPVTIISKLVAGKTPADMTSLDYNGLVTGTVKDPTQLLQVNGFMSLSSLIVNGLSGGLQVFDDAASSVSPMVKRVAVQQPHQDTLHGQLQKFQTPHALHNAVKAQMLAASGYNILTDWKLALGEMAKIIAIPTNTSLPGYPIRWISWLLGCVATLISAAIRSVTVEGVAPSLKEQALAATGGTIALVNFALICTINGLEFTNDYSGRDLTFTSFQVMSSIFDLVASEGSAAERLVK
ncbi:MAG: hypothetical protein LQ349_004947, partial [Xanthoria aureola]